MIYVIDHNDTTRTVTTYDETGAVTSTRPYTAAENAAADAAVADAARLDSIEERLVRIETHLWPPDDPDAAAAAQHEADRLTVRAIITDLQAEKARAQAVIDTPNATIKSNPAPYVNDVARAAKRIADAAIDLARYVAP